MLNFAERLFGATFGRVPTIGDCVSVMAETVEGFEITMSSLKIISFSRILDFKSSYSLNLLWLFFSNWFQTFYQHDIFDLLFKFAGLFARLAHRTFYWSWMVWWRIVRMMVKHCAEKVNGMIAGMLNFGNSTIASYSKLFCVGLFCNRRVILYNS